MSALALVSGVAVTALSANALGQTVTMSASNPVERKPVRSSSSTDSTVALTLNKRDCDDSKVHYTFNVNVTGRKTGWALEVWAGQSNCANLYTDATRGSHCWKLGTLDVENNTASGEYSPQELFGVGTDVTDAILNSCDADPSSVGRSSFSVYFLLTTSNTVKASASQELWYDLGGPAAPGINSVGSAESALKVNWDAVEDEEGEIVYQLYCAETSGLASCQSAIEDLGSGGTTSTGGSSGGGTDSGGTDSGGTTSTGGSSGGGTDSGGTTSTGGGAASTTAGDTSTSTSTSTTSSLEFKKCGKVRGLSSQSGYTSKLTNGKTYAVRVATIDAYDNEGEKSEALCGTPELVDTFFERYRNEGGKAGGSFCSLGFGRRSLSAAGLFLLSLGAIASLRRRRANAHL